MRVYALAAGGTLVPHRSARRINRKSSAFIFLPLRTPTTSFKKMLPFKKIILQGRKVRRLCRTGSFGCLPLHSTQKFDWAGNAALLSDSLNNVLKLHLLLPMRAYWQASCNAAG